ncbi:hypothetical protein EJD97_013184, partial [Solanum chilense]
GRQKKWAIQIGLIVVLVWEFEIGPHLSLQENPSKIGSRLNKVNGDDEWLFGFCEQVTRVFSCPAGKNPIYSYRECIVFGNTNHTIFKVNQILRELSREWPGHSYEAREASDTGKQFVSWKKLKLLGRGSYGTVSLATPLSDYYTLFAAVKSAQDDRSSSLRAEAQILHALRGSDYVIHCFGEDVSIENGKKTYNLFLEYAAAGTLNDLIHKSNTVLGEADAAYYAFQILVGICHVHRKGFIHCDLKPANILVFPGGQHRLASVKLADFGVSLRSETKSCWDTSVMKRSRCRGTLLYAPPESVVCGIQDKGVDIWAFGCILVEMLTGKRVWSECKNKKELKLKIEHEKPEIPTNISNDAKHFLSKCLDTDHNWRWNAEMLLLHPFITNYVDKKMIRELIEPPFGDTARLRPLVSMENLFTTTSFYYHDNSSSDLRGSSSIITRPPETNNDNARGTTRDEMNFRNLHI